VHRIPIDFPSILFSLGAPTQEVPSVSTSFRTGRDTGTRKRTWPPRKPTGPPSDRANPLNVKNCPGCFPDFVVRLLAAYIRRTGHNRPYPFPFPTTERSIHSSAG
jgi:hypothetical protein